MTKGVAIFDLDRTLTRRPTWARFLLFANRARPGFWVRMPALIAHGAAHKLDLASRDSVKAHALKTLDWMSEDALTARAGAFTARELEQGLRPGARAAIEAHRERGDRLVLATAAADLIAGPIAAGLGFDQVICTPLARDAQGRLTLAGANCYGPEKLARVKTEIEREGPVAVYSDHVSDLALMDWADEAIAVNPSSGLARAAAARRMRIADWNKTPA